jgi:HlyD family secretion protein
MRKDGSGFMKEGKKKKIWMIPTALILVAAVSIPVYAGFFGGNEKAAIEIPEEMVEVKRMDLVSSLSATGVLESVTSETLTSSLTGVLVKELHVEVGDFVEEGTLLAVLDTEMVELNIANVKKNIQATKSKNAIEKENATQSLEEAKASRNVDLERNDQDLADAWTAYDEAGQLLNAAKTEYETAQKNTNQRNVDINTVNTRIASYQATIQTAKTTFQAELGNLLSTYGGTYVFSDISLDQSGWTSKSGADYVAGFSGDTSADEAAISQSLGILIAAKQTVDTNTTALATENATLQSLQAGLQTLQATESAAKSKFDAAENTYESKETAYTQKLRAKEDTIKNSDSSLRTKENTVETVTINSQVATLSYEQQLKQYEDQLAEAAIYSSISGVVTSALIEEGTMYTGGSLLVIESENAYQISTEIDEHNIGQVELGQEVLVKTNGTGEEELRGEVISIAPRATQSAGQSVATSDVTYTVKIKLLTAHEDLKMDMTAKLSIILESKKMHL